MRIGISAFGTDRKRSGIGEYVASLLREFSLAGSGHTFDVFGHEGERSHFCPEAPGWNWLGFGPWTRDPLKNLIWHQLGLPRLSRARRWDVLFLPSANRRLPFYSPCPTVGTVHDFSSLHVQAKYDPGRDLFIKKMLPLLMRRLTSVITISQSSRADLEGFARVSSDRITIIPQAADTNRFRSSDRQGAQRKIAHRYRISSPFVLYVSRIEHPGKNHVRLIEAFDSFKHRTGLPHSLVLVGNDWDRAEAVHDVAGRSPYRDDIVFTGFAPDEDLPDLYSAAELFMFPSLYEGFGIPILEAMACGTPVACSNVSSMPEVAGEAAEFFDPRHSQEMADLLVRLLGNSPRREELRHKGLARSAEFSWTRTAERTLEAIEQAAARSAPAGM